MFECGSGFPAWTTVSSEFSASGAEGEAPDEHTQRHAHLLSIVAKVLD